jgi:HEAT repeat protein
MDQSQLLAELTSGDDERSEAAAVLLATVGEGALPGLSGLLTSTDADERWWAVRTLAAMREPPLDAIAQALRDPSGEVRAAAALAIAAHPGEGMVPELIRALGDEDSLVSTLCVDALVSIGRTCVPSLLEAFPHSSRRERIQMMRALAAIKDPTAIGIMLKSTEDESAVLNYWARQALEALGLDMVYLMPE